VAIEPELLLNDRLLRSVPDVGRDVFRQCRGVVVCDGLPRTMCVEMVGVGNRMVFVDRERLSIASVSAKCWLWCLSIVLWCVMNYQERCVFKQSALLRILAWTPKGWSFSWADSSLVCVPKDQLNCYDSGTTIVGMMLMGLYLKLTDPGTMD